jgi:hypothetical protein
MPGFFWKIFLVFFRVQQHGKRVRNFSGRSPDAQRGFSPQARVGFPRIFLKFLPAVPELKLRRFLGNLEESFGLFSFSRPDDLSNFKKNSHQIIFEFFQIMREGVSPQRGTPSGGTSKNPDGFFSSSLHPDG